MNNAVSRKKSAIQKALDAAHEPLQDALNEASPDEFLSHDTASGAVPHNANAHAALSGIEASIHAVLHPAVGRDPLTQVFDRARAATYQGTEPGRLSPDKLRLPRHEKGENVDDCAAKENGAPTRGADDNANAALETGAIETGAGAAYDEDSLSIWWKNVHGYPLLGAEREVVLAKRIATGDRAAEKEMIESNLRLVASIARKCRRNNATLSLADLVQEGSLGLIRAVHKFDHSKGYKFSTYASYWIRQAILRAIDEQSRSIRLPVYVIETAGKTERARVLLTQELHRPPTTHELAAHLQLTLQKVQELSERVPEPISLDTSVGEDDDSVLADFIEDERALSPADCALRVALRDELQLAFGCLTEREANVLNFRYGLDEGGHARTLDEVGALMKLTRERVRQIEKIALRRLKQCAQLREIAREFEHDKKLHDENLRDDCARERTAARALSNL